MKKEEEKNSFILYNEQKEIFDSLDNENAGKLIKAIFEYEINQKLPEDPLIKVVFISIRQVLDKNKEKWEEAKRKKSEAGKKGMQNRWGDKGNSANGDNTTKKRKVFKKPTIEEIKQYCTERNNKIDAKKFWDFYESKGWKVGKNTMKDWRACVRTWENNEVPAKNNDTKAKSYQGYSQREYTDEELEEIYDNL